MRIKLTTQEINELLALHKITKDKTNADKIKCLILYSRGWSWSQIEEALLISKNVISYLLDKYKEGGIESVLNSNYVSNNNKMTKTQEQELCEYVENNFVATSKCACMFVKEKFGIDYTENGMVLVLKRLGFVFKKPKIVPGKIPSVDIQEAFIKKTEEIFNSLTENEAALYVDASGLVHNVKPGYGWIKKGKDKIIKTNTGRDKIDINGLYNPVNNEIVTISNDSGSTNQQSNMLLIEKYVKLHPEKKKFYVFLDNAKINKGKLFFESLSEVKVKGIEIELVYLPTYSPNLNLIERLWKYCKKILLSTYHSTFRDFRENIE